MSLHALKLRDVVPQPWRNGGGVTRELLTWPTAEYWLLRLSVADIDQDGSFSAYPGVERWFAVMTGNGIELSAMAEQTTQLLSTQDKPIRFDGEWAPKCRLVNGSTRDLNLMIRRDFASGQLQRLDALDVSAASAGQRIWAKAGNATTQIRGLFTLQAATLHLPDEQVIALDEQSMVYTDSDAALSGDWRIETPAVTQAWVFAGTAMTGKRSV